MSWFDKFKLRLQFFAVMGSVLFPSLLAWTALSVPREFDSYYWPGSPGVVESTVAKPWQDDHNMTKYYGRVAYRYTVAGQEYQSDFTDFGPGTKRTDPQTALGDVAKYQPGDKVTVYYDPRDPKTGVLVKGIPEVTKILLVVLSLLSVVCIIAAVFAIRSWLRLWFARKSNAEPSAAADRGRDNASVSSEVAPPGPGG